MFATGLIPTTLAHMLRSTESLFIAAILVSSGHQKLSLWSTASIVVVFIGVYLESVEEMNRNLMSSEKFTSLLGISLALMSNVNLGMRALAVKSYNSTSDVKASYYTVCSYGAICLLPAFCWVNKSMLILTCPENIVACIFHLIYSEASFYVLSKVDAASHGFIKMGSRVAIVLSTAVAFKFEITPLRSIGLLLIASGIISYVFGKPKSSSEFELPQFLLKRTKIAVMTTSIMLIISTSYLSPPAGSEDQYLHLQHVPTFTLNDRSNTCQTKRAGGNRQLNRSLEVGAVSPCSRFFSIHRIDRENVGDLLSAPYQYFPELSTATEGRIYDIESLKFDNHHSNEEDIVIIGGGGLLRDPVHPWSKTIVRICEKSRCIGWGLGLNVYRNMKYAYPDYAKTKSHGGIFNTIGIRDKFHPNNPLLKSNGVPKTSPDATCLHPEILKLEGKCTKGHKRKIGYYLHDRCGWNATEARYSICTDHPATRESENFDVLLGGDDPSSDILLQVKSEDVLFNGENRLSRILKFICSSEVILTSSYHGALWASYLDKKVIVANPFSSKFDTLDVPVRKMVPGKSLERQFQEMPTPKGERQVCAKKNEAFYEKHVRPLIMPLGAYK